MLLCLAHLPYGYYEFMRFFAMIVFTIMAYRYYKEDRGAFVVVFFMLALLFQPFIKIALGRTIWNIVDVIVAALLVCLFIYDKRKEL